MKSIFIIFAVLLSACSSPSKNSYVMPPNGGGIVTPSKPVWVSGTLDEQYDSSGYTLGFPKQILTSHLKVVNSGYWLNFQNGEMQAIYELTLSITDPFKDKVYTRATLENPSDSLSPFIYEHHLLPNEKTTKTIHGPVTGVKANQIYTLKYEVYKDQNRTIILETIVQKIQAGFDNNNGCIVLNPKLKSIHLPSNKFIWPCKRT